MTTVTARRFFSTEPIRVDPVDEYKFYSSLKMRNGTFKLTRPSRFAGVEAEIRSVIEQRAKSIRHVLDVGASTGRTTIELADFLCSVGASARVVGTDLFVDAHLIEVVPGLRILTDAQGWPLQYDVAGLALRAWIRRLDFLTLAVVPRVMARALLRPRLSRKIAEGRTIPVRMESPALAARSIELVENDIFVPTPNFFGRFDLIRAANILNKGYFPAHRLTMAISNIRSYCRGPGALVLVLRSEGEKHNGSLFELGGDSRLHLKGRVGSGSEIEPLILGVGVAAAGEPS
jgi:SAM-dependent methyltransferase